MTELRGSVPATSIISLFEIFMCIVQPFIHAARCTHLLWERTPRSESTLDSHCTQELPVTLNYHHQRGTALVHKEEFWSVCGQPEHNLLILGDGNQHPFFYHNHPCPYHHYSDAISQSAQILSSKFASHSLAPSLIFRKDQGQSSKGQSSFICVARLIGAL